MVTAAQMRKPSPSALLRAASVLTLLYCLGHMSGYPWTPGTSDAARAVVAHMKSVQFVAAGAQRTYWDFYFGFGLISGAYLALQCVCIWWLASIARRDVSLVVPILWVAVVGIAVNTYLSYHYFFAVPALFSLLIGLLVAAALWRAKSAPAL
jgi:hypothetical protein